MPSIFDIENKEEDLYSVLNCVATSSPEQIKTEYKRLALLHHPDKQTQESSKDVDFDRIKAAYDIVGDPINRAMYERWRQSGLIIPFSEFAKIGAHAQTVHWQSLPTQMTLTSENQTDFSAEFTSIRVPPTMHQLPRVQINKTSFWNKQKAYTIQK